MYLNEIYMGRGYGFQSAALSYLGKNATDMNVAEAALLTAILNRPGIYDPFRFPERAKARRDLVLDRMAAEGYLTGSEASRWKNFPLPEVEPEGTETSVAPYFTEWVRQILDSRFGAEIYTGGFRVHTTLDVDMQLAAQAAMEVGWAAIEADSLNFKHPHYEEFDTVPTFPGSTPYLQGAFIALDPLTGQVKAMIEDRRFPVHDLLLTTEKDAVKLRDIAGIDRRRIGVVKIGIDFEGDGGTILQAVLDTALRGD